jgi:hypothetical protein
MNKKNVVSEKSKKGQNEDQQGKKRQITAKQSETKRNIAKQSLHL